MYYRDTVGEWESGEGEPRPTRKQRANEPKEKPEAMGLERMQIVIETREYNNAGDVNGSMRGEGYCR